MKASAPPTITAKIAEVLRLPESKVTEDVSLQDLTVDSFVLVELVVELQEEFGVQFVQEDLPAVKTVGDVVRLVNERQAGSRS